MAYGYLIRAGKEMLVESLGKSLVEIAWKEFQSEIIIRKAKCD